MKTSLNLNSTEWCDIIFEGKNKSYGAFELRQSAWKGYLAAFGIVLLLMVFITFLPSIASSLSAKIEARTSDMTESYVMVDMGNKEEKAIEIEKPFVPEPPMEHRVMEKYVPPVIVKNEDVNDENTMTGMSRLLEKKDEVIGKFTVKEGSTDMNAARKEFERDVTGGGTGGSGGGTVTETIFVTAEYPPLFLGGESEMYKYIYDNLKYPVPDQEMGNQGKVTIRFVVTKTGEIAGVEVLKGVSPGCDKEAMKVISDMPKWVPGKQNGTPVSVYYTIPIIFKLK